MVCILQQEQCKGLMKNSDIENEVEEYEDLQSAKGWYIRRKFPI